MPSFDKSPPELMERFAELAALVPEARRKQMFGYPSCVLGGNMFMGPFGDGLILRLAEADRREVLGLPGTGVFEPMPGRPMKEYVLIPRSLAESDEIERWVTRSRDHALSLPAKKPRGAA